MTVVNYAFQDIFDASTRSWVGVEWFQQALDDDALRGALLRQLTFSFAVLAIQIPLGIALALAMPARGWGASLSLVLMALPLLIPWNVVGTIWQIIARGDIGLVGWGIKDRKSTRLNSSHANISYAVFCLKKKSHI